MVLRIAHFSDLHYADETLQEVDRCFAAAVEAAITRNVDVAIISGDATDHALPSHSPAFAALARRVRHLADHCPVLMLQGTFSHEPPGSLAVFSLLGGHHPIVVVERLAQVALLASGHWLVSDGWRFDSLPPHTTLLCSCVPTLNPAALACVAGAHGARSAQGPQIAAVLSGFAPGHRHCQEQGIPTIGVAHGTVVGCLTEHGVPMAGLDHEFTARDLFAAEASAFLLGHIHRHQSWRDGLRLIAYAGSAGRLHFGEQGDKGFLLWNLDADGAEVRHIATPARRMLDIAFDGPPDMAVLQAFATEQPIEGALVRVRWTVLDEERDLVDRRAIEALLQRAAGVKLEGRVLPVVRSRAPGIGREPSIAAQLRRWAEASGIGAQSLLACLSQLEQNDVETIATALLAPLPSDTQAIVDVNKKSDNEAQAVYM